MALTMLTQERLKQVLHYDPITGFFTWQKKNGKAITGRRAGTLCKDSGYRFIKVDGSRYREARLAWLYMTGDWPPGDDEVDHENRKRGDNRWENLRPATAVTNKWNTVRKGGSSGIAGASYHKASGRYLSSIREGGRRRYLGYYDTAEEAGRVYEQARLERSARL